MNENPGDDPIPATTTGSGVTIDQVAAVERSLSRGRHFHPVTPAQGRCDWLMDRYPVDFVRSLVVGGRCDVRSRAETLPTLDSHPWGWVELVHAAYAIYSEGIAIDPDQIATALREFADAGSPSEAAEKYDPQDKERGLKREQRAGRAERRMDQPWRKQHR